MYQGHTVGVVVPAYNESGFVGEVVETLPDFVDRAYVVDDCSTDDTWTDIERAAAAVNTRTSADSRPPLHADGGQAFEPRIIAIRHEQNRGVGGALKTGYRRASEDGLDVVAVMNGDGQMDPDDLHRIIEPVVEGRADYAKGNRLTSPDHRSAMPAWRLFGNGVLTLWTKFVSGYWRIGDPQNGYTAISGTALDRIDLDRLYDGYGFLNDMLVHCNVNELRVEDVPMHSRYGNERSHIRYSKFVPSLSWLLCRRGAWRYKRKYVVGDFHPLVFLLVLGIVGGASGLVYAGWFVATVGVAALETLVSLVVVLLGGFFLSLAMVFDRLANERLEPDPARAHRGDRR